MRYRYVLLPLTLTVLVFAQDSGDFDDSGVVDLRDFADFELCFAGSERAPAEGCPPDLEADLDFDGDVDFDDS